MRIMVTFAFPTDHGNTVVASGKINEIFGHLMEDLEPEAVYLFPEAGVRGGLMVVNVSDSSAVAGIAERFWHGLHASVELRPVMNPDDLTQGLANIEQIAARYS